MRRISKVVTGSVLAISCLMGGASAVSADNGGGSKIVNLTPAQETCMANAKTAAKGQSGVTRKATMKAAAQSCGVWKRFSKLSTEQQSCLASKGLNRPAGAPTKADKRALRALAATCGITLKTGKS